MAYSVHVQKSMERAKVCGDNQSYTNLPLAFAKITKQ